MIDVKVIAINFMLTFFIGGRIKNSLPEINSQLKHKVWTADEVGGISTSLSIKVITVQLQAGWREGRF